MCWGRGHGARESEKEEQTKAALVAHGIQDATRDHSGVLKMKMRVASFLLGNVYMRVPALVSCSEETADGARTDVKVQEPVFVQTLELL